MTFLHPILAAAGIAAVSIPIIIHLLMRRRRKPVLWGAMRFLLEAYKEHRRRLRLEQFLLLAARCLVIALIGLGLARPMFGGGTILGGRAPLEVYLLVDNSLTASAGGAGGPGAALERHKAAALRILDELDGAAGDRAGVIALGGPADPLVAPASADLGAVRSLVSGLEATDSAADLQGALAVVQSTVAAGSPGATRTVAIVLSDFLTGSADTERRLGSAAPGGTAVTIFASRPAPAGEDNITITAVEPLRPILIAAPRAEAGAAERTPVTVRLRRSGPGVGSARVSSVRLRVSGADDLAGPPTAQATVRWAAGESEARASVDLAAPSNAAGTLVLTAAIDDDAIAGDNTWRRTLEVRPSLRVGLVAPRRLSTGGDRPGVKDFDAADWLRVALDPWFGERAAPTGPRPARDIDVVEIEPASVDAARLSGLDAVILARPDLLAEGGWRHLRHLADTGGLVLAFPPATATVHLWADALVREFNLDWTVAREARAHEPPATIQRPEQPGAEARGLLTMIEYELEELAARVVVSRSLPVEVPASGPTIPLLALSDGSVLALASPPGGRPQEDGQTAPAPGRGLVVLVGAASAIEWTNLQTSPLMVPLLHELIVQGVARSRGDWSAPAGTRPEAPGRSTELRPVGGGAAVAVDATGRAADPFRRAGLWRAVDERGAARGIVTVHADPVAGRTDPQPASAIQSWLADAAPGGAPLQWLEEAGAVGSGTGEGPTIRERLDRGNDTAPWAFALLVAALGLALLELGMARWFSHASAPSAAPGGAVGAGGARGAGSPGGTP